MLQGRRFLDNARLSAVVLTLASTLELGRALRFLARTPVVNARDDELMGRFKASNLAADVIADDQEAVVYSAGQMEIITTALANVKIGRGFSQSQIQRIVELETVPRPGGDEEMELMENRAAERLVRSVRARQNALIVAMRTDEIEYARLGVILKGASFGMPADLKFEPETPWSDPASTPLTDIQVARDVAADKYGKYYNRLTLSRKDFSAAVSSTEFKAKVTTLMGFAAASAAINTGDRASMESAFSRLLDDMTVEIEDATYEEQTPNGATRHARYLPVGTVELSDSNDDGNPDVMDLGNAIITESAVAAMAGNGPAGLAALQYGPVGYYEGTYNPPKLISWGVARCWPRKHQPEATSVIKTGVA